MQVPLQAIIWMFLLWFAAFELCIELPPLFISWQYLSRQIWTYSCRLCTYFCTIGPYRRHQMETFSALPALCVWNSPVPGEFHAQGPMTRSYDVFFDLRLNKRLGKQSWGWQSETSSRPFWRHCNALAHAVSLYCLEYFPRYIKLIGPVYHTLDPLIHASTRVIGLQMWLTLIFGRLYINCTGIEWLI